MSDTNGHGDLPADEPDAAPAGPHRVIGTPPPAEASTLLGAGQPAPGSQPARELPADPPSLARASIAERVVATCFIIAMLAGIGFIAAYIGLPVHSLDAVLRSNLALGITLSLSMLGLAFGATIWVRNLMPPVEITEARKPLASAPER